VLGGGRKWDGEKGEGGGNVQEISKERAAKMPGRKCGKKSPRTTGVRQNGQVERAPTMGTARRAWGKCPRSKRGCVLW